MSNPVASLVSKQAGRVARREAAVAGKVLAAEATAKAGRALAPDALVRVAKAVTADDVAFKRAVAGIEAKVATERALQIPGVEGAFGLQPHMESLFMPQAAGKAKGTVVMFHGFTAGPWQYQDMAELFHKQGYHVYAPRLPGHGATLADGTITGKLIPGTRQDHLYDRFLDETFAEVKDLGAPIHAVGLSGGGNMALRLAEKHPEVEKTFVMAPFWGPDGLKGAMYKIISVVDTATFGLLGRVLDRVQHGKNGVASVAERMPHTQPSFGSAVTMRDVGAKVKALKGPVQIISTVPDAHSGIGPLKKLLERNGGTRKNGWYHFQQTEGVPHAMLTRSQNKVPGAVDTIEKIALDFIEEGKLAQRPAK